MTKRGTPFFMAPELKPNDVKSCNPFPVDVFAFGVTLMLLMNPDADCQQLTDCDWSQVPNTPPAVLQLGRRCTQRDPLQRPTMQEVHDELQRVAAALAELQSFLECAGVVPAGDCAAFARGLSAQGVDDAATLQRVVQENTGLCSEVGMSLDQQGCLTQYVNQQIAVAAAAAAAAARIQSARSPAAAAARIVGKDDILKAAKDGNLELVQDHVAADPASVRKRDERYASHLYTRI
jgi:hypothetical protein